MPRPQLEKGTHLALRYSQSTGFTKETFEVLVDNAVVEDAAKAAGYEGFMDTLAYMPSDGEGIEDEGFKVFFDKSDRFLVFMDLEIFLCSDRAEMFALLVALAPMAMMNCFRRLETDKTLRRLAKKYPSMNRS